MAILDDLNDIGMKLFMKLHCSLYTFLTFGNWQSRLHTEYTIASGLYKE